MTFDDHPSRRRPIARALVRRVLSTVVWATIAAITAALAFAYALPQRLTDATEPYAHLAAAAFFGRVFTFHAGLLLAAAAALAAALRRWRLTAFATAVAAAALWPTAVACLPRHPPAPAGRPVRVMSMNVKYSNRDGPAIVAQVRAFNPDVLAVEEVSAYAVAAINAALGHDYPYRCLRPKARVGLALYSRLPFDAPPVVTLAGVRLQIRAVIRIGGRPTAVYVVHPLSPRSLVRLTLNRLSTADLATEVATDPLPTMVVGDFNFTAETPQAVALRAVGLTDAFDLAARGRGSTWPVRPRWAAWLPGVRIDHVYLSPGLTCTRYQTGGYDGSDHLPIVADLALAASGLSIVKTR